jgi:hypothetical protein
MYEQEESELCRISGSDSAGYKEFYVLGYNAVYSVENPPTFLRNISQVASRVQYATCFHAGFLLGLLFDPEDGRDMFLRNVGGLPMAYTTLYPRRYKS